jgi:hypothetical protein
MGFDSVVLCVFVTLLFCSFPSNIPQVVSNFAPSNIRNRSSNIDVLTVTIVAPTFLLGHMFGLSIFPMLNDALVESLLSTVLLLACEFTPLLCMQLQFMQRQLMNLPIFCTGSFADLA